MGRESLLLVITVSLKPKNYLGLWYYCIIWLRNTAHSCMNEHKTALFGWCYIEKWSIATDSSWCFSVSQLFYSFVLPMCLPHFLVYSNMIGFLGSSILGDLGDLGSLKLGSSRSRFLPSHCSSYSWQLHQGFEICWVHYHLCHLKGRRIKITAQH